MDLTPGNRKIACQINMPGIRFERFADSRLFVGVRESGLIMTYDQLDRGKKLMRCLKGDKVYYQICNDTR